MPVKINTGTKEAKQKKIESVEQQGEQTLEEQLVALIGSDKIDKAAHLYSQMEDIKAKLKTLESDYKPLAEGIQTVLKDADLPPTKKLLLETETGTTLEVAALRKTTDIADKEALYHALEEKQDGLYFELSKVGITECKNYVPVKGNIGTIYKEGYGKTRGLKFKF